MNQSVEFFTTGDPYLIEAVLNAVMMALDAGGLGAGNAIGGAMAIGILVSAINALMTGEFSFNKLIAAFVVWFTMFGFSMGSTGGTRYDAVITGPNGSTAFVTDLPLGIAMPFYVLGIVGPEMNDVLTTAFALPRYVPAGDGSADSVRIPSDPYVALMNLRQWTPTKRVELGADEDLAQSMVNYVSDCYNANLVRKGIKDEIDNKSYHNYWPSIDTGPIPFTTEVYFELSSPGNALNSGEAPHNKNRPAEVHCDIAHQEILSKMDTDWVNAAIGDMEISSRVNVDSAVALTNATVAGSVTAANLVRSEFARYVVRRAAVEGTADFSNLELSMEKARFRAMQDKNTKGAAEFSYYNENWTIMLQVFEIICYFVTVLIPFLILISGGALLKILLAWLTLVVWVNTIPITAVLSRLFVEYYASLAEMCANPTSAQCLNLQTVGGIEASYTTIETALGMGGTIAQLMPTVTLFLLTGSAYALMGAANSAPKASTDTSNINPKFGGVVNSDGSVVNSRGLTATLGAETGASVTVANSNGTSGSVSISNNYNRASSSSGALSQTAGKEVGKNAVEAVNTLNSTSAGTTSTTSEMSKEQQQIQKAQSVTQSLSNTEKTAYGEDQTLADKYGEVLSSTMAVYAGLEGSAGLSALGDFLSLKATAGIKGTEQEQEVYERASQQLQKMGYSKEDADQLVRQEQFQNSASEMAEVALDNRDSLSVLSDTSRSSIEQFQDNAKRAEAYQKTQSILESASSSTSAQLDFVNNDFMNRNDGQFKEFETAMNDYGLITQSDQLDMLTQGLDNKDDVISDFQQYASQNDYSNATISEKQEMLESFVDQQKQQGVDFSQGEKKLNTEIANAKEDWNKRVEDYYEQTGGLGSLLNPAQQLMMDKTRGIENSIDLKGTSGDALELQKYDDRVDMLTEFMTSPDKSNFLTGLSESLAEQAAVLAQVNDKGGAIEDNVNETTGAIVNSDGRLTQDSNVKDQLNQQYSENSQNIEENSPAADVTPQTQEQIERRGDEQSAQLNEKFEQRYGEAERIIDDLEAYNPLQDSSYKVDRGSSYEDETKNYLDSLPINENLEKDMTELFNSVTDDTFDERLRNGFALMGNKELSPNDLTPSEERDYRLAQAYTATQDNPQLSDFNNVLGQLNSLSPEVSDIDNVERMNLNGNSKYFTNEGRNPSATTYAKDVRESGRYQTDFKTTSDFIMETAKDIDSGGLFSNSNINALNAAKALNDGDLRETFNALQKDGERKDGAGQDTKLLAISAIGMMRNGDAQQKELGEDIGFAVRSFKESGGDYNKFKTLYSATQGENYGRAPQSDQPEKDAEKNTAPYDFNTPNSVSSNPSPLMPIDSAESQGTNGKELSASQSGSETQGGNSTSGNTADIAQDRQSGASTPQNTSGNAGANDANGKELSASQSGSQAKGDDSNDEGEIAQNNLSGDEKPVTINESSGRQGTGEKELSARASETEQAPQNSETETESQYNEEQRNEFLANTFGSNKTGSNDEGKA